MLAVCKAYRDTVQNAMLEVPEAESASLLSPSHGKDCTPLFHHTYTTHDTLSRTVNRVRALGKG